MSGNIEIVMYVETFISTDQEEDLYEWAKGGIMLRDSLQTNSVNFSLFKKASKGITNQYRTSSGGDTYNQSYGTSSQPVWLKVTKTGSIFTAYYKYSANADWSKLGDSQTINFSGTFYYGIAVCSHNKRNNGNDVNDEAILTVSGFTVLDTERISSVSYLCTNEILVYITNVMNPF